MASAAGWLGRSIERVEDAALLTGRGRYIDDLGVPPGTLHAAILRSSHPHAKIRAMDTAAAAAAPGVAAVITGAEVAALSLPLVPVLRAPLEGWPIAVERVRYVGEPVAVVVAADRYLAEDALDLIEVDYDPLPAVVDPLAALEPGASTLHAKLGSNVASDRSFRYGDPEAAFAAAPHRIAVDIRYPRNSCTPIETYGLIADYDPDEDVYDVLATFQGPFSIHAVLARALKVPGNRLRLRTRRNPAVVSASSRVSSPISCSSPPPPGEMGRGSAVGVAATCRPNSLVRRLTDQPPALPFQIAASRRCATSASACSAFSRSSVGTSNTTRSVGSFGKPILNLTLRVSRAESPSQRNTDWLSHNR